MCRPEFRTERSQRDNRLGRFSITRIDEVTWLIREHDAFGEYPHIYARICSTRDKGGSRTSLVVLNDTGVGTIAENHEAPCGSSVWTIRNFIEHHLNPSKDIPYLIILSHCHYDHILGLQNFLSPDQGEGERVTSEDTDVTIMSSSFQKSFLIPHGSLEEHSLCKANHLNTPRFVPDIWALDEQRLVYKHKMGADMTLPIITIHTPGHTPDSLSWYDEETRRLYVGDSLYQQETDYSRNAPWGREAAAPIIFPNEGNILQWWRSVEKLEAFVKEENVLGKPRVTLAAGHVTAQVDAAGCLKNVKSFIAAVLRGDVPCRPLPDKRGKATGYWAFDADEPGKGLTEFSVVAPLFVIEEGRGSVPPAEWLPTEKQSTT
ncbi:hypothetical protein TruAng_000450 [Truncatella angustata]|nr:hypothetical protein TruAng_000450 [Truncatella angustata]